MYDVFADKLAFNITATQQQKYTSKSATWKQYYTGLLHYTMSWDTLWYYEKINILYHEFTRK